MKKLPSRQRAVDAVLAAMRHGVNLQLTLGRNGDPSWDLSDGTHVPAETAKQVIVHYQIEPCGDALFEGVFAQTYRHRSPWPKLT
ncbi:hypothetical protein ACVI1L_001649 [Bradyrhizobium sp. USDA 4516]